MVYLRQKLCYNIPQTQPAVKLASFMFTTYTTPTCNTVRKPTQQVTPCAPFVENVESGPGRIDSQHKFCRRRPPSTRRTAPDLRTYPHACSVAHDSIVNLPLKSDNNRLWRFAIAAHFDLFNTSVVSFGAWRHFVFTVACVALWACPVSLLFPASNLHRLKLRLVQIGIESTLCQQLVMCALLDDIAVVDN